MTNWRVFVFAYCVLSVAALVRAFQSGWDQDTLRRVCQAIGACVIWPVIAAIELGLWVREKLRRE